MVYIYVPPYTPSVGNGGVAPTVHWSSPPAPRCVLPAQGPPAPRPASLLHHLPPAGPDTLPTSIPVLSWEPEASAERSPDLRTLPRVCFTCRGEGSIAYHFVEGRNCHFCLKEHICGTGAKEQSLSSTSPSWLSPCPCSSRGCVWLSCPWLRHCPSIEDWSLVGASGCVPVSHHPAKAGSPERAWRSPSQGRTLEHRRFESLA